MKTSQRPPIPFYSTAHLSRPSANELVKQAKASLQRPSRPFTPALSLDRLEPTPPTSGKRQLLSLTQSSLTRRSKILLTPIKPADAREQIQVDYAQEKLTLAQQDSAVALGASSPPLLETPLETDQGWNLLLELLQKFVLSGDIRPLCEHLESLSWLRSSSRPDSPETASTQNQSIDKEKRRLLVDWLVNWTEESDSSLLLASALILRLSRDESITQSTFKSLFNLTLNESIEFAPQFFLETVGWWCDRVKTVGKRNQILVYVSGIIRNLSMHSNNLNGLVGCLPSLVKWIGQIADHCVNREETDTLSIRLSNQIIPALRNFYLHDSGLLKPKVVETIASLLLESSFLSKDENLVLLILKFLGNVSESQTCHSVLSNRAIVDAFHGTMIRFMDQPV
jgi:hypothetical protein